MTTEVPITTTHHQPVHFISRSKNAPPAVLGQEIRRSQVLELLEKNATTRLWLLLAPAGYGKTTAMCQIMQHFNQQGFISIWLNFDDGDNDIFRFLIGFATAIAPYSEPLKKALLHSPLNEELAHLIIESLNAITEPTTIYFDNFEAVNNPAVCGLIARGIEALPDNCRIVIGSRTKPNIGLSRLITRNQVCEIDSTTLRFSIDETVVFMAQNLTLDLNQNQIQQLQQSTEGWPAALKLARIAIEGRQGADSFITNFSGSNAAIAAFLAEEVLFSLPETMQTFLLESSILEELNPAACNRILKRTDSLDILLDLEKRHLFLTASGDNNELFRYHSLFRDFLLTQLQRRHLEKLPLLHARACEVYLAMNRPVPAIRHALKADIDDAVKLLKLHADELLSQGRIGLLTQLLDQVPDTIQDRHPHLKLIYALCLTYTRGPHIAYKLIKDIDESSLPAESAAYLLALRPMQLGMMDRIQEAHQQGLQAVDLTSINLNAQVTLSQALTQTCIILGEHDQARYFCDQARSIQGPTGDMFNQVLADTAESSIDLMGGHLKQASQRIILSMQQLQASPNNSRRGITIAAIKLAEILYEQDKCKEAKQLLITNSALVQEIGPPDTLINANVILSRIVASENDYDTALQLLIELEQSGHRLQIPRVVASARLERARLWLSLGDISGASEQLALSQKTFDWTTIDGLWFSANDTLTPDIVKLRLLLYKHKVDQVLPPLRALIKNSDREHRARRALKLRILLAEALFSKGDRNAALRTLNQAILFARPEGFIRMFIEEDGSIAPLLHEAQQHAAMDGHANSDESHYARQLATRMEITPPSQNPSATGNQDDRLTGKELEVLKVLALGLSNMAMAEKLFVSESTVRTHLRSINLKLNAKNRTEAVNIARQLGLFG